MKRLALAACVATLCFAAPARADSFDLFSWFQTVSVADVQKGLAIYAANPNVPTYKVATQCLTWGEGVLTSQGNNAFNLQAPVGVVSTIADIDVALNGQSSALPQIVYDFNENCGAYKEDLIAQAAALAGKRGASILFGLIKLP